jgi:cyclic pyranopterin phosphate synthase
VKPLIDLHGRRIRYVRVSVTDRCNLRCRYCMPLDKYEWVDRHEILTYEEITTTVPEKSLLVTLKRTGGETVMVG